MIKVNVNLGDAFFIALAVFIVMVILYVCKFDFSQLAKKQ